jgi:hypothetical protein
MEGSLEKSDKTSKRIYFKTYESSGKFPDGRIKLDIHFRSSDGQNYIWTHDWEKGARQLFLEAYRIERLNKPESPERERFREVASTVLSEEVKEKEQTNWKLLATQLGEAIKYRISINEIGRIASAIFDFQCTSYPNPHMTSSRSQAVYDWVMTLGRQPITKERKTELYQSFVLHLGISDVLKQ